LRALSTCWTGLAWVILAPGLDVRAGAAVVEAELIDGTQVRGTFAGVRAEGQTVQIRVAGQDGDRLVPSEDLLRLRFAAPASATSAAKATATAPTGSMDPDAPDATVTVWLNDGGRLEGRIAGTSGAGLTVDSIAGRFELRRADLAAVRFGDPRAVVARQALEDALHRRDGAEDLVLLLQEGRVTALKGTVESLTATGGTFTWRGRTAPIRRERTYAVVFAAPSPPTPPSAVRCVLADGSVLAGRLVGGDEQALEAEVRGARVRIEPAGLSEIAFASGRVTWLSDLEPAAYRFEPMGGAQWPYRRDRSAAGRPIRIGDVAYDRGIGMHAPSSLDYALAEPHRLLVAVIGIDAGAAPRGHVVFRVLGDGQERFNSGPVTGRDPPRTIRVPIEGVRTLTLCVDLGEELDIGDQADWAAARLVR